MTREILFRGKTANGEWVYGYYGRSKIASPSAMFLGKGDVFIEKSFIFNELLSEEVIPETVGQYVGIKDKNGKKIFDGDILRVNNSTKSGVVEFKDFEIRCDIDGVKHRFEYETVYEVIGTVFDKESDNGD